MILRPFEPRDAATILSWICDETEFYKWSADRYGRYPIAPDDVIAHYAGLAASGRFFPLTAFEVADGAEVTPGESAVGHLIMRYTDDAGETVRFGFIIVDPARRGEGLGRRMIEAAVAHAAGALGAKRITIGVFENNAPARRCYAAAGFREAACEPEYCRILGEDRRIIELEREIGDRAGTEA